MRDDGVLPEPVRHVAEAVAQLALDALQGEHPGLEDDDVLWVAEAVWNAVSEGSPDPAAGIEVGEYGEGWHATIDVSGLAARLAEVRRARWGHLQGFVFGLEVEREGDRLAFGFQLVLEEDGPFHDCTILCQAGP